MFSRIGKTNAHLRKASFSHPGHSSKQKLVFVTAWKKQQQYSLHRKVILDIFVLFRNEYFLCDETTISHQGQQRRLLFSTRTRSNYESDSESKTENTICDHGLNFAFNTWRAKHKFFSAQGSATKQGRNKSLVCRLILQIRRYTEI